jgi:hypothetical protein
MNPKFKIGDKVFVAFSYKEAVPIQCPDCRGKLVWSVTCPSGEKFTVPCHTCQIGYSGCCGTINEWRQKPKVEQMTIGSVRFDSNAASPVSYMCVETGVGSGSVYGEERVFDNEIDALKWATEKSISICSEENERERKIYELGKKRSIKNPFIRNK